MSAEPADVAARIRRVLDAIRIGSEELYRELEARAADEAPPLHRELILDRPLALDDTGPVYGRNGQRIADFRVTEISIDNDGTRITRIEFRSNA